jgi:hypothetical protein
VFRVGRVSERMPTPFTLPTRRTLADLISRIVVVSSLRLGHGEHSDRLLSPFCEFSIADIEARSPILPGFLTRIMSIACANSA